MAGASEDERDGVAALDRRVEGLAIDEQQLQEVTFGGESGAGVEQVVIGGEISMQEPKGAVVPSRTEERSNRVYVGNLAYATEWQDLKDHFRSGGVGVVRADVLRDAAGRSRGCGIVELRSASEAAKAIAALDVSTLQGRQIHVREDREAVSRRPLGLGGRGGGGSFSSGGGSGAAAMAAPFHGGGGGAGFYGGGGGPRGRGGPGARVFVANLPFEAAWQDLKDHMRGSGGDVIRADILQEPGGRSKGCGVVEYASPEQAQAAIAQLNNTDLMGRSILVREDSAARAAGGGGGSVAAHPFSPGAPTLPPSESSVTSVAGMGTGSATAGNGGSGGGRGCDFLGTRIYVANLSWDTAWQELKDHCRRAGAVVHADVMTDAQGQSRGCGVVEFETPAAAARAVRELHGTTLGGRTIIVRPDRSEGRGGVGNGSGCGGSGGIVAPPLASDFLPLPMTTVPQMPPLDGDMLGRMPIGGGGGMQRNRQVFVGNLPYGLTWNTLKDIFRQCGEVVRADVMLDADNKSKGWGIVRFARGEEAAHAIAQLHGTSLSGRVIEVREDNKVVL